MPPVEAVEAENVQLRVENTLLREQVAWLRKQIYGGGKSEKLDEAQLKLKLEQMEARLEEQKTQTVTYERNAAQARKSEPPKERFKDLPVQETVVIEPEEVKADPDLYERIGEEKTFEVDITPPKLFKREIIRPKYRFKLERERPPVIAPALARPVEGGYASAGLLAWVVLSKYLDHLPLYRQEKMSPRWGAYLSRKTMADWVETVAGWLKPIYNHMRLSLLAGDYIQADETPIRYQDPDTKKGKSEEGWMWLISKPGGDVVFDWRLSRRHGELTSLLDGYTGLLQSDGYGAYNTYGQGAGVTWIGCWAHARRKFYDALDTHPREAGLVLALIARLYGCEKRYREKQLDPESRNRCRLGEQKRILKWIHIAIRVCARRALPKSSLGKACSYTLKLWEPLCQYLYHGQVEIDNNLVENAIRPSALGKKNWLFIGSRKAGDRSAIIYSLAISCQRHGIDPHAYLKDVLSRLPRMTNQDDIASLAPVNWKPLA